MPTGTSPQSGPVEVGTDSALLKRSLSLTLLVLYGLGVTIGAGIYVLIGTASARAGAHAPFAFMLAAIVMGLTGATFAELAGRYPQSAGEAAYVNAAFGSDVVAILAGALVLLVALVSAATIAKGAAGYLGVFVSAPQTVIALALIVVLGGIAALGISEAVGVAAVMTLLEIGGLLVIIVASFVSHPADILAAARDIAPTTLDADVWRGIFGAFLVAVFAFIGFESIVNLAEEAHTPAQMIPRAILITLVVSTVLYCLVILSALAVLSPGELGQSSAPLALVFQRTTGASPKILSAIAVFATVNGVIAQLILAARLLYGLARQGNAPAVLATVSKRTQSPVIATAISTIAVAVLAALGSLAQLADITTRLMLIVFVLVNAALLTIKRRGDAPPLSIFIAPTWVPVSGLVTSATMLIADLLL